ncbi:MAG: DnaD domain protein, partial [Christensenellales bacterium]
MIEGYMAFCRFTGEFILNHYTMLDNLFVNEYLPYAPEKYVKIYIWGLYLCSAPNQKDNSDTAMAATLGVSPTDIENAYKYWEEQGLILVKNRTPLEVQYLPVKTTLTPPKKYKPEKYAEFNSQLQALFPTRMITPMEFNEYYGVIEGYHIQPEAMIMIIQYCVNMKGVDIRFPYILTVAKDWANSGVHTYADVEEKLKEYEAENDNVKAILKALGRNTSGDMEDRELYLKWTKSWGFEFPAILRAAKQCKRSVQKLDALLDEYYRANIYSEKEMIEYRKRKDEMYALATSINKIIGVYYEVLDHEVETYISIWLQKGFDEQSLRTIAQYCFKSSIRTLEGMNNAVNKFYKLGLISVEAINNYIARLLEEDAKIDTILKSARAMRKVNAYDREYYHTWSVLWGFSDEMINYAATLSADRAQPFPYVNQILSRWKESNIHSVEQAKAQKPISTYSQKAAQNFQARNYTSQELGAFFGD